MTYCQLCGEEDLFSDDLDDFEGILVCNDCYNFLEENNKITGKIIIERCKKCGHIKDVGFERYKKKGRKPGTKSKRKEKPIEKFMAVK